MNPVRSASPVRIEALSRRALLQGAGCAGAVFALGVQCGPAAAASAGSFAPNVFVTLDGEGAIVLSIPRVEMGQGIRTSLAMIIADEMAASWSRIAIRQADGDPRYGDQDTDQSRSIRQMYRPLRLAGATARLMLEAAAATIWRASVADCRAVDHEVIHVPTGRIVEFGQLAKIAATLPVPAPERIRLKDSSSHRYIGHSLVSLDQPAMIHGKPIFAGDIAVPGMKFASVTRCPVYGGALKSFDPKAALQVHGVERVIEIPGTPPPSGNLPLGGVAVIAANSWSAQEGRRKLDIVWDLGPNAEHGSVAFRAELEAAARLPAPGVRNAGLVEAELSAAATRLTAEYFTPYVAAATMETPVAVAVPEGGKLTLFAATQNPQGARTALAQYLQMKESDITVRPTFLGNGFGRKELHDFLCEAGFLARAIGQPVKLTWTREDDLSCGYYQPMCAQLLQGGLDKNGAPIGWLHRSVFPSIAATFHAEQTTPDATELGQGLVDMPYAIRAIRCEAAGAPAHLRLAGLRSGMNIPHAFAIGSFMDELAVAAGKDPANFLFTHLAGPRRVDLKSQEVEYPNYGAALEDYPIDAGRLQDVLQFAVERSGWSDPLLPHQGRGVAIHRSYLSYVAGVAVVTVGADGKVSVPRFDIAIDCGRAINPDRIRALMEDQVMYGIGIALFNAVAISDGVVGNANFDTYLQARAEHTPEIHVHLVVSSQPPGGVGDSGVPVVAPAIANAIFAACGKRVRALPIDPALLKDASPPQPPNPKD